MSTKPEPTHCRREPHHISYEPESPKSNSIVRSLAELDTLLTDDTSMRLESPATITQSDPGSDKENYSMAVATNQQDSVDSSSGEKQYQHDADSKSVSRSVVSSATTVLAGGLISNMDKVNADIEKEKDEQSAISVSTRQTSKSLPTMMSRSCRSSISRSKCRRLRGKSLEREISRIIHLSADQFVEEPEKPTTSAEDILKDLMATTPISIPDPSGGSQLRDLASLLDQSESEEETITSGTEAPQSEDLASCNRSLDYGSFTNAGSLVQSDSDDSASNSSNPLQINNLQRQESKSDDSAEHSYYPEISVTSTTPEETNSKEEEDNTDVSCNSSSSCRSSNTEENSVEAPSVISEEIETYAEPTKDIYQRRSRQLVLVSSPSVPGFEKLPTMDNESLSSQHQQEEEESTSFPVVDLASQRFEVSDAMVTASAAEDDEDQEEEAKKETTALTTTTASEKMDDTVATMPTLDGSSFAFSISQDEQEWTSFGNTPYFGETYSPEKHPRRKSPSPTNVSEPNSPSSVLDLPAPPRDTRKKSSLGVIADTATVSSTSSIDMEDMPYDATFPMTSSKRTVLLPCEI
mmetsp:Transcript_17894/g.26473  ORF Transcript_17894/g.26473 Transcript_17894/m.26473 type:complete len:579 (+) Transcript_17894:41-1777(+)